MLSPPPKKPDVRICSRCRALCSFSESGRSAHHAALQVGTQRRQSWHQQQAAGCCARQAGGGCRGRRAPSGCIQGDTNEAVAKHYRGKLVGDTPEFCLLDSNLLSDFETAMRQNLAYTYWLPHNHPDKFLAGTAKEVQDLMERTWAHPDAVRDERIVEDICRFPAALEAIIAAKGAKVEHLDNSQGRRRTRPYEPPCLESVEELLKARFERLDPVVAVTPETNVMPPKKRQRCNFS